MSSSTFNFSLAILLGIVLAGPIGCSTGLSPEETQKKIEELQKKIENYEKLEAAIKNQQIKKRTASFEIITNFGQPDDKFTSGSNTGSFEIWTYEKVTVDREEESWENIRLYFDNGKLVSWSL